MIKVDYKNSNVQKYCESFKLTQKDIGPQLAKKLSQRLDELRSFNTVYELLNCGIDNPHMLVGDLGGCIGWDLSATVRLILRICDDFTEKTNEEIKTMTNVVVEGVRDYHDRNKKWLIN